MKTKILIGMLVSGWLVFAAHAQITVNTVASNSLAEPCGVTADSDGNFYVADSVNNRIDIVNVNTGDLSPFTGNTGTSGTNDGPVFQAQFFDPEGVLYTTYKGTNGLLVADTGNHTIRLVNLADGFVATLAGVPGTNGPAVNFTNAAEATFRYPVGLALNGNNLYIADSGNNAIRVMSLSTLLVTTLAVPNTTFYQPNAVAIDDNGNLWVADTRNNAIKLITLSTPTNGTVTSTIGGNSYNLSGTNDNAFGGLARFSQPRGLLWVSGVGLLISDTGNNSIRLATNYAAINATNYAVTTFAGSPGTIGYLDGLAATAQFNSPFGLCTDPFGNEFLVADMGNNALRSIQNGPALPPVSAPAIGWVKMITDSFGDQVTQLQTNQPFVFNNDVVIAIAAQEGTETYYTVSNTPSNPLVDDVPNPSATTPGAGSPPSYEDGLSSPPPTLANTPDGDDFEIKAISILPGSRPSPISEARFEFVCANPVIVGDNAADFTVQDQTSGSELWYTLDGSVPVPNGANSISNTPGQQLFVNIGNSNVTFTVEAFRANYKPSGVVSTVFSPTNFVPNEITYGFSSGEASSAFVGSPGQTFFAPVTLSTLPTTTIYSMQFNSTVTNVGTAPQVTGGEEGFISMLEKPNPQFPGVYERIPPAMYLGLIGEELVFTNVEGTNIVVTTNIIEIPDSFGNPPPTNEIIYPFSSEPQTPFLSLSFTNTSENLIGVGWLETHWVGGTNLYNSQQQDLITYSQAHDTLFLSSAGKVVVGAYTFTVPSNAVPGQQYQIQLGRPSATDDGIGEPGSDVYIDAPTNGVLGAGAINSIKVVTVGQRKYVAGDVYPFGWFNAGDFGDTNLDNADVLQVFSAAIYGFNTPEPGSDFYDAMDSCCVEGTSAPGGGYLIPSSTSLTNSGENQLYSGNDTAIDSIAFGDGVLDVSDVYVTFRRSLDPQRIWYERFWTNGVLGALPVGNPPTSLVQPAASGATPLVSGGSSGTPNSATNIAPGVNFTAGDAITGPGQTLEIPITASVFGSYPLRVLMLNLTVEPLDGSPALTNQVQFIPNPALGTPTLTTSVGIPNYAAAWLNSTIAGLTGTASVGTLVVTLPGNAPTNSAYAVHFDHASGSPNGVSSFPRNTFTGLITLADRSGSSWNDGIPDSWRLRYFGTVNNLLSAASADADGDGVSNYAEYIAGTDPTDPNSYLHVTQQSYSTQGFNLHWPSVAGKTYVIESSPAIFGGTWTPVSTNTGTGGDMYIQDAPGTQHRFYRVLVP